MKRASRVEFDRKSMETESTTWSGFPDGGKASAEQILVSEETNPKDKDCERHSLGSEKES